MKLIKFLPFWIAIFVVPSILSAQTTLTCKMVNCNQGEQLNLYELQGIAPKLLFSAARQSDSSFVFNVPATSAKFYGVGVNPQNIKPVILGAETAVTLWGNCEMMSFSRTVGSPANKTYDDMMKKLTQLNQESRNLETAYRTSQGDPNTVVAQLKAKDTEKVQYIKELQASQPLLSKIAVLFIRKSYETSKTGSETLPEYIGKSYFQNAVLGDPIYNTLPQFSDAFGAYAIEVANLPVSTEVKKGWIAETLKRIPANTGAYRMALAGVVFALKEANSPLMFDFGEQYVQLYKDSSNGEVEALNYDIQRNRTFTPGMQAPDLSAATPEGGTYALSQMRGKYVLIDFWASWCGPCIREMPSVKAVYDKYKDKGFDILGVSLDQNKDAWVNKINDIGMPWKHISDLAGWQSKLSGLYSVTSIPQTVLVDKEGKIVARNLRGEQIEAKLKELLGE